MDKLTEVANLITHAMDLELVDAEGETISLGSEFVYDVTDPYAVTAVFKAGTQEIRWTFGRDLLIEGIYEPSGDGDVHVWPCLSATGGAVVIIELSSPDGEVLLQARTRDLTAFVEEIITAVPEGTESTHVDIDDALSQFFVA
jgi:hypothetical protein